MGKKRRKTQEEKDCMISHRCVIYFKKIKYLEIENKAMSHKLGRWQWSGAMGKIWEDAGQRMQNNLLSEEST